MVHSFVFSKLHGKVVGMSLWSILLRVLLSLSLLLNGVSAAAATIHVHGPMSTQSEAAASAKVSQVADESPCHQHQRSADTTTSVPAPAFGSAPGSSPDACKASTCGCVCVHATQATLPGSHVAVPALEHTRGGRQPALAHAAPALPHLIRPPIG